MTEEPGDLAGLLRAAYEHPEPRALVVVHAQLLHNLRAATEELAKFDVPLSVIREGLQDPAYLRWTASKCPNRAALSHVHWTAFFAHQINKALAAVSRGEHLGALYAVTTFVTPPFQSKANPGGRKAKIKGVVAEMVQETANLLWRSNPRLSALRVAEMIHPGWCEFFEAQRLGDPPTVRTLRSYIKKPAWAKDQARKKG